LKRPESSLKLMLENNLCSLELSEDEMLRFETEVKYEGYITRQSADIQRFKKVEKRHIPSTLSYNDIRGISREAAEKLNKVKPLSLGQASRIPGLSQCDLSLVAIHMEKMARSEK
jgi:tRNA uridine 5-carboxymethylaminomethyl modification enzyme